MKKLSVSIDYQSYNDGSVFLDVAIQNESILTGFWTFDVRLGKKGLIPESRWTKICEHMEKGCEYTEIELHLSEDYRFQRSLLLNHKDKHLLLADSILAEAECKTKKTLSYCSDVQVSPKLRAKTSGEATEIEYQPFGRSGVPGFRVLPLALPEWKASTPVGLVSGKLIATEGRLVLLQATTGRSLFAPLLFDLDAERLSKRYTWRQLTVGEDLQLVSEDRAVGYRIQLGKRQFLLYRSLTPQTNRTVLGHNLIDDFCFARFDPESGVEPLIAVEVAE